MNEKITSLLKLQTLDNEWDDLRQAKTKIGPQREKLKGDIQAMQTLFEESKKALTDTQVTRKSLELDIETKDQAIRKAGGELNSVKSNDAYKALLSQIDESKKAKTALEDKVLELMEKMETLQKDIREREKALQQNKGSLEEQIADLDAEEQRLTAAQEQKKAEREAFAQSLPADLRQRYDAIRRGRSNFSAIVPLVDQICGGCRTKLPPSVLNEVMKGKDVVVCDGCSRILYIPPKEPVAP